MVFGICLSNINIIMQHRYRTSGFILKLHTDKVVPAVCSSHCLHITNRPHKVNNQHIIFYILLYVVIYLCVCFILKLYYVMTDSNVMPIFLIWQTVRSSLLFLLMPMTEFLGAAWDVFIPSSGLLKPSDCSQSRLCCHLSEGVGESWSRVKGSVGETSGYHLPKNKYCYNLQNFQ